MVLMHLTGIHILTFQYCNCEQSQRTNNLGQLLGNKWYPATTVDPSTCATFKALETFRLLNVVGNVTVHNFIDVLERKTDPVRVETVPDRYKAFWADVAATKPGGLTVACWACPHDGKNLPQGWGAWSHNTGGYNKNIPDH
ncbi:CxC2 domain-containing protein [Mycena venus]|uniref:CxC2 domain-containing protein n=1 Tax=Mycena venus TaxID=2733690 RepID=A0A8H6YTD6_9AGAR|nr:CxC2 domain-containing protein [Mycena venus]